MYYTPISDLISLVILTQCIVGADHSWSPIVQGRSLVPPTIPPPSILNPVIDNDISGSQAYRRRTWLPLRRRRRRRWYWVPRLQAVQGYPESRAEGFYSAFEFQGYPESRAERLYSASQSQGFPQFIKLRSRPSSTINYFHGTPRALEEEEGGFIKGVRGLFGAPEHCLEGGQQYACTFAPVCWLTGGVVSEGEYRKYLSKLFSVLEFFFKGIDSLLQTLGCKDKRIKRLNTFKDSFIVKCLPYKHL